MSSLGQTLPGVAKPFMPFLKKRAATYAADYLNDRRQARLTGRQGPVETKTIEPEVLKLKPLEQKRFDSAGHPVKGGVAMKRVSWLMVLSGLLGGTIGAIICFIMIKR